MVYLLFVIGLTLPIEVVIIPLFYEVKWLGLLNTKLAIILPLIGLYMPFSIYWMRAHFVNVPIEMSEAAEIDGPVPGGSSGLQVPLARAPLLSLAILQFLWTWNSFLLPMVLVEVPLERTMAGALGAFQGNGAPISRCRSAPARSSLAPTIILFLIFQKQLSPRCSRGR